MECLDMHWLLNHYSPPTLYVHEFIFCDCSGGGDLTQGLT